VIFLSSIQKQYKAILFVVCFTLAICAIYTVYMLYTQQVKHLDSEFVQDKKVELTIQIDSDITRSTSKFVFFAEDIQSRDRYKVTQPPTLDVMFGDCLHITGTLSIPKIQNQNQADETSPLYVFPYRQYLAKDDIYLLLQVKTATQVQTSECPRLSPYSRVQLFFMKQKEKLTQIFLTQYEQPYAGLAAGVLVAGKGLLDKDSLDMFKRTSLSHIVVLSGSNVSIILVCIKMFVEMLFFWKKEKSWCIMLIQKIIILLAVWMFMLLTGGGAPIYRAVTSAYCGMILFQEKTSQVYALSVTILILTILSPFQTLYDPSFHLTCCATFGLILFSKPIDTWIRLSYLRFIPNWLREIISVTLATQIFVFPYIMFMTSSFSPVFLISNVLILPIIPMIMLFGFITLCADLLHVKFLVDLSVYINNIFLHIVFYVVKILAEVPYLYIVVTKTTSIVILVVYGCIFGLILLHNLQTRHKSTFNNTPI
jgi:competence protein ComEC